MTKDEALDLMLNVLELINRIDGEVRANFYAKKTIDLVKEKLNTNEALAQPEHDHLAGFPPMLPQMRDGETIVVAQPEQEPVGEVLNERGEVDWISFVPPVGTKLYTTPPQRKPLTKTRVGNYLRRHVNGDVGMYRNGFKDGVRFAEAAHGIKEKNT